MSLALFQGLCIAVLLVAYTVDVRSNPRPRRRLVSIGVLAVAACLGEHSVIEVYAYYGYAPGWWLPIGHVPLLVPIIWPLVVLSARDVAAALWPGGGLLASALRVGAIVVFDASIMEVFAVAAGYWSWAEGGYLGVPLMGIAGWGVFGAAASVWLDRRDASERPAPEGVWLPVVPVALVAATHAGILALWWGLFRWGPRVDLGVGAVLGFAGLAAIYAGAVARAFRSRPPLPPSITAPRVAATSVFVALLISLSAGSAGVEAWPLWAHLGLAAVPYLLASWPRPDRARAPSSS